ncbi:MAG: hypothetical protein WKF87_16910 [Chryseolinea sp.]
MTLSEFKESLRQAEPPNPLPPLLKALWYDAKGDWNTAHNVAQDINTKDGSWIHAYLHRKEGDGGNAAYWYRRASQPVYTKSLSEEWDAIAISLLSQ